MKMIATDFLNDLLRLKTYIIIEKQRCANIILNKLISMGFYGEVVYEFGSPIVIAEYDSKVEKNILFYSHYDVKPEGNVREWNTEPFMPTYDKENRKVYARGAGDDKGQIFAVICGIEEALRNSNGLCYNITLVIEGDEENGSHGLNDFCRARLGERMYDAVIINDSHWFGEYPVIYTGVRGQQSIDIRYKIMGMEENQHAGNYGGKEIGAAKKFMYILLEILGQLDDVMKSKTTTEDEYGNAVSLTHISSGDNERSTIPKDAFAKIDIRYVDLSIPQKVYNILEKACNDYNISYEIVQQKDGFYNLNDKKFIDHVFKIIKRVTGIEPKIKKYCGAYLPMRCLSSINGIKYVIPFAQADENNHAPNENISLEHIGYGIKIIKEILTKNK